MRKIIFCMIAFIAISTVVVAQPNLKTESSVSTRGKELKMGKDGKLYSLQNALEAYWTYRTGAKTLAAKAILELTPSINDWSGFGDQAEKEAFFTAKFDNNVQCGIRAGVCSWQEDNCVRNCGPDAIACLNQCATNWDNCMRGCPASY